MSKERIESDMKQAMKRGDAFLLSTLRLLSASLHNREIEKRGRGMEAKLSDEEIFSVIRSEVKKRLEAAAEFRRGGREDLEEKELAEAKLLQPYLPSELSTNEIRALINEGRTVLGVSSEKEMGKLIGWVMERVRGRASGVEVSRLVREALDTK